MGMCVCRVQIHNIIHPLLVPYFLQGEKINVYTLRPLSEKRWEGLKRELDKTAASGNQPEYQETLEEIEKNATMAGISRSEANSTYELTSTTTPAAKGAEPSLPVLNLDDGVILDAGREIRIKLYMGQVHPILRIKSIY
jgi:phosphatidylinositol-3,4,5-trisphosphate 3-phosphatase/dual-specificity protein phosphatase PTEN